MTKEEIYSVFDGGDAETALMKLAVSFPRFGRRDLEGVLRTLASSKDEYARSSFSWLNATGGTTFSGAPTIRSCGREAFKTIFFIMFRTCAWDGEILFQPDFLPFVCDMKAAMATRLRLYGRRDGLPDFYEEFAEMEERLIEKIRNRPEGAACLG